MTKERIYKRFAFLFTTKRIKKQAFEERQYIVNNYNQ